LKKKRAGQPSVRLVGLSSEIRTRHLNNRGHRLYLLSQIAWYFLREIGSVLHLSQTSSDIRAKGLIIPSPRQSERFASTSLYGYTPSTTQ